jgi:hypothetical protein
VPSPLFEYVAWFRDETLPPEDQDYEWPGIIYIRADTLQVARDWGDHLAQTCLDKFLWSNVEPYLDVPPVGQAVANDGEELTANEIGW